MFEGYIQHFASWCGTTALLMSTRRGTTSMLRWGCWTNRCPMQRWEWVQC